MPHDSINVELVTVQTYAVARLTDDQWRQLHEWLDDEAARIVDSECAPGTGPAVRKARAQKLRGSYTVRDLVHFRTGLARLLEESLRGNTPAPSYAECLAMMGQPANVEAFSKAFVAVNLWPEEPAR